MQKGREYLKNVQTCKEMLETGSRCKHSQMMMLMLMLMMMVLMVMVVVVVMMATMM